VKNIKKKNKILMLETKSKSSKIKQTIYTQGSADNEQDPEKHFAYKMM